MLHDKAIGGPTLHNLPPSRRIEARQFGRHHRFADGRRMDFPKLVIDQFGNIAISISADFAQVPHGLNDRPNLLNDIIIATNKHWHIAANGGIH